MNRTSSAPPAALATWVVGNGGHARVVAAAWEAAGGSVAGFIERSPEAHCPAVVPEEEFLRSGGAEASQLLMGIGCTRADPQRMLIHARYVDSGFRFANVLHPAATVAASATIGEGAVVLAGAVVGPGAEISEQAIVNHGAIVDHDARIGRGAHVAPGAVIGGAVELGDEAFAGAGSVIRQGLRIGAGATVGAGAVVVREVPAEATVVGCPARVM